MKVLIDIIQYLIIFNVCYWGLYFLISFFYDIDKLKLLIAYLLVGLIIGLFTTREKGSRAFKRWDKVLHKLDRSIPSRHEIIFTRMIGWPIGIIMRIKTFFKETKKK